MTYTADFLHPGVRLREWFETGKNAVIERRLRRSVLSSAFLLAQSVGAGQSFSDLKLVLFSLFQSYLWYFLPALALGVLHAS
jgi:hypothetical protein